MKAALVTHFFPPESGAAALRVRTLAEALERGGHDVTVVTSFPSFPLGRFAERHRPFVRVTCEGRVRVVRLFSFLVPGIPGARILHWLSAALSATLYLLTSRTRYDVVIVSSPPITLALPALAGAARHRARLIVDVRDVFPDIAVAMGAWKADSLVVRLLERIVRQLYRRADLISVVTPTALEQVAARGIDRSRIVLARNAAERTPLANEPFRSAENFTAVYAGNLGLATNVDVLVDAAALVARDGITIEIVGDGTERTRLAERVEREGITNLRFAGSLPREEALARLAGADVSIVPLRKGIEESIPTKIYDAISVGCPLIVAADGEARTEGTSLGARCTPAGDAPALAAALRELAALDKSALRERAEKSKALLDERADRTRIMEELVFRIATLHARSGFASAPAHAPHVPMQEPQNR